MLIEGLLTDTRRSSDNGLDAYCRLERIDYQYMANEMRKKNRPKTNSIDKKKLAVHKFFVF